MGNCPPCRHQSDGLQQTGATKIWICVTAAQRLQGSLRLAAGGGAGDQLGKLLRNLGLPLPVVAGRQILWGGNSEKERERVSGDNNITCPVIQEELVKNWLFSERTSYEILGERIAYEVLSVRSYPRGPHTRSSRRTTSSSHTGGTPPCKSSLPHTTTTLLSQL